MNVKLPMFGLGAKGWTAFDATEEGFCAVTVRNPKSASGKPQVIHCASTDAMVHGAEAIRSLAAKVGASGFSRTLVLSRNDYQMIVVPEPPVLEAEIQSSLRWTLASMIDFPIQEANIDWMRIPTAQYQPDREKQLYAIVARDPVVAEQAALFDKAHAPLTTVDIRETALRNLTGLLEKGLEGTGLVTVGPGGVATTFTFKGELYLDRFIAQSMDEIASGDSQRRQKFFDRVAQQVYQSMELITRTHPFISVERIVLGPTPDLMELGPHLAGKLPVPVHNLELASIFDISATPQLQKPKEQARYLVALGAALRGLRSKS